MESLARGLVYVGIKKTLRHRLALIEGWEEQRR